MSWLKRPTPAVEVFFVAVLLLVIAACAPTPAHGASAAYWTRFYRAHPAYRKPWRSARASWYGGGSEPQATAYGGSRRGTRYLERRGICYVAHRSLPFGTKVLFRYRGGRQVTAVVWDRGPARWTGRTWDLGATTKRRLRFKGAARVQYKILRRGWK